MDLKLSYTLNSGLSFKAQYDAYSQLCTELLIVDVKKKNQVAERVFYERFFGTLLPIAFRYMVNEADAREALQVSFIKIFDSLSDLKNPKSLKSWLKRVVVYTCLDMIKGRRLYHEPGNIKVTEQIIIEPQILHQLSYEEVMQLVRSLEDNFRITFSMHEIDGFSHAEIAKHLNISEGTSRWYLYRAKQMLKDQLSKNI